VYTVLYCTGRRCLNPLHKYSGPFVNSMSEIPSALAIASGRQHSYTRASYARYGNLVSQLGRGHTGIWRTKEILNSAIQEAWCAWRLTSSAFQILPHGRTSSPVYVSRSYALQYRRASHACKNRKGCRWKGIPSYKVRYVTL